MPPTTDSFMYQTMHRQPADVRNLVENGWEQAADAPWDAHLIEIEGGTHAASIGEAYRQAMLWLFRRSER